jgi:tetratricopeptide (TPR) repeat protein
MLKIIARQNLPRFAVVLLLILWTVASYAPCLNGPFFFDDEHFIQKNSLIHSLDHVPELYTSTVTQGAAIKGNFYRPNQQLVYALLYQHYGQSTTLPYHLVSLMLHIASGILILLWLGRLGLGLFPAATGAALFLLHPVQTEAVCYISGLADPLATFFMLVALVLVTPPMSAIASTNASRRLSWRQVSAVVLFTTLALFTKESSVVLAPFVLLSVGTQCLARKMKPDRSQVVITGTVIVLAILSVVAKFTMFKFGDAVGLTDAANPYTQSLILRLTTFVSVLWDYVYLLFWPKYLFYEKPYTAYEGLMHARGAFGSAMILLGLLPLLWAARVPRLALGVGMVFAALIPFSGIVPLNAMYLEHWLYVPMIGVALLLALIVEGLTKWVHRRRFAKSLFIGVVVVVACSAVARTRTRSAEWANIETFYLNEIDHAKNPGRIYNNLGMYYADLRDEARAIKYYELAVGSDTGRIFAQPHHNLALAYVNAGRMPEAMRELRAALQVDREFIYSLGVLRDVFARQSDKRRQLLVESAIADVKAGQAYDFPAFEAAVFAD